MDASDSIVGVCESRNGLNAFVAVTWGDDWLNGYAQLLAMRYVPTKGFTNLARTTVSCPKRWR